ncbi:MAG TPA: N-acetyltransferase [Chloroflexus aurantiacus]|mgnify:FL=1|jgi:ribosomal protein S18 acetylase RimI-like enzyme|uniref:GCN5-related N-acetyltransferase n=1 Tax=Chloroflexus aurantiacus (strain ATCC 29366 / DSM 635 / J-10-fl) TaxID=324602 RepID=A9WB04_CHLAA|nr:MULTISPECIES: GNAT family N-acetyltransferase [Chloroflexus]ABY34785.1 GCN5-related N-acetyltransferase [Chloroflexus aurantiacus J-10-fl]RMG46141.1 MAG: GNAT family N-acetyltransferase [Chloroflexota bacterium]HBW69429.1 N-acetyltransferase [Chloroflexus aurantiacus]
MPAFIIRPAIGTDIPDLARLIVELYHSELPGALSGCRAGQERLLAYTLQANGEAALTNRLVVCDDQQRVIGTGMLQFPNEPAYERAPRGTIAAAVRELGIGPTLKLASVVARSLIGVYRHTDPQSALIHSVVITAAARGQGAGQTLMAALEEQIRSRGLPRSRLQVLANNTAAQRFYRRCGYDEIWRLDGWRARLGWPSLVMEKVLV